MRRQMCCGAEIHLPPCTCGLKKTGGWSGGACPSSGHANHRPTVRPAGHASQGHGGGFTARHNAEEACGHQDPGLGLQSVISWPCLADRATSLFPAPGGKQGPLGKETGSTWPESGEGLEQSEGRAPLVNSCTSLMHLWPLGDTGLACPTQRPSWAPDVGWENRQNTPHTELALN